MRDERNIEWWLNSKARMVELLLLLVLVLVCEAHGQRAGQGGQHHDELVGGEHLVVEHRLRHGAHLAVEHVRARHLQQLPLLVRKRKHIQVRYTSIERNKQTLESCSRLFVRPSLFANMFVRPVCSPTCLFANMFVRQHVCSLL